MTTMAEQLEFPAECVKVMDLVVKQTLTRGRFCQFRKETNKNKHSSLPSSRMTSEGSLVTLTQPFLDTLTESKIAFLQIHPSFTEYIPVIISFPVAEHWWSCASVGNGSPFRCH